MPGDQVGNARRLLPTTELSTPLLDGQPFPHLSVRRHHSLDHRLDERAQLVP
jgi:hypothetical protein